MRIYYLLLFRFSYSYYTPMEVRFPSPQNPNIEFYRYSKRPLKIFAYLFLGEWSSPPSIFISP
nr:MAG TPA: hypothetical protein [Caudoviricetes sp.]